MKKDNLIMPAIILCVIGLITTGILALTYEATRTQRDYQTQAALNENRLQIFPDAADFQTVDLSHLPDTLDDTIEEVLTVFNSQQEKLGTLFVASWRGYAGSVPVMAGISTEGKIVSLRVLANEETPGLGKKIEDNAFLQQFTEAGLDQRFAVQTDQPGVQKIDIVSGATISSRAVAEAANQIAAAYAFLEEEADES